MSPLPDPSQAVKQRAAHELPGGEGTVEDYDALAVLRVRAQRYAQAADALIDPKTQAAGVKNNG